MADLRTRYLGLELRSPLVASSSPLTGNLDGLARLEAAGAGAVVLPSLFEEDLAEETRHVDALLATGATGAEARAGHPDQAGYGAGPRRLLGQLLLKQRGQHHRAGPGGLQSSQAVQAAGERRGGGDQRAAQLQPQVAGA